MREKSYLDQTRVWKVHLYRGLGIPENFLGVPDFEEFEKFINSKDKIAMFNELGHDKMSWYEVSKCANKLTVDEIKFFKDYLFWWGDLFPYDKVTFTEDDLRFLKDEICWSSVSKLYDFSDTFILEFKHLIDWRHYLKKKVIPESIIRECLQYVLKTSNGRNHIKFSNHYSPELRRVADFVSKIK
jgi:hypothetical protein